MSGELFEAPFNLAGEAEARKAQTVLELEAQ